MPKKSFTTKDPTTKVDTDRAEIADGHVINPCIWSRGTNHDF